MVPLCDPRDAKLHVQTTLRATTLDEYLQDRPPSTVLSVHPDETLASLSQKLAIHGIVSCPVIDGNGTCLGFVDMMDVASALIDWQDVHKHHSNLRAYIATQLAEKLETRTVRALDRANDGQTLLIDSRAPSPITLLDVVLDGFVNPATKLWCHRLVVLDAATDAAVIAVLSQSDILRHIHRQRFNLPDLMACTLRELGFQPTAAMAVPHDMPTLTAFASLAANAAAAAAVMQHGKLVGSLSASDLRGLGPSQLHVLALPVVEFLEHRAAAAAERHIPTSLAGIYGVRSAGEVLTERSLPPVVSCELDTRFGDALELFVQRKVHRVFLTQPDGALAGQISINDVLLTLCSLV